MIELRRAGEDDAPRLLAWRNDPATRAASFSTDVVDEPGHRAWLARRLADPRTLLLIAEADGEAVAQVRVEREPAGVGVVSIAVAPDARGRGLATPVLEALAARADLEVGRLRALIRPDNERSLRAFVRAGYAEVQRGPDAVVLERRVGA